MGFKSFWKKMKRKKQVTVFRTFMPQNG